MSLAVLPKAVAQGMQMIRPTTEQVRPAMARSRLVGRRRPMREKIRLRMTRGQATTPMVGIGEKIRPMRPRTNSAVPGPLRGGGGVVG
jgi:ribose 1,5-bisphosphokinase PhnN